MRPTALIIIGFCLLLGQVACEFRFEKAPQGLSDLKAERSQLSYAWVRAKVFAPNCVGCHDPSDEINFETYATVKNNLSRIDRAVFVDRTMPKRGTLWPEESNLLRAWIDAGAPEFASNPEPEPSPVLEPLKPTFASIRNQVFENRCMVCHRADGTAHGVPLNTLSDLLNSPRDLVLPGNPDESGLLIAVSREDSKRMPPPENGGPLCPPEIAVIRAWIEAGAPETTQ